MLKRTYTIVMDSDYNGLSKLPKIVRFQIMTFLALMWSVIFCSWTGSMYMVGPSMGVHAILLLGVFFTANIFRHSKPVHLTDHRSKYRDSSDGCALYDDIWGG